MNRRLAVAAVLIVAGAAPARAALINVRDYPSPAAAFAAAHPGDRVYFPSPGPYQAPTGGWKISKSLEIFGDGVGDETLTGSSGIVPDDEGSAFVLDSTKTLGNVYIHDLLVRRDSPGAGPRDAIHGVMPDGGRSVFIGIRLERMTFISLAHDAIHLDGGARNGLLLVNIADCQANSCLGSGLVLRNCTTTTVTGGYYHANMHFGIFAQNAGIKLYGAALEGNQSVGASNDYESQLRLQTCHAFLVEGCHFEEFSDDVHPAKTAISVINCWGGRISSTLFYKNGAGNRGSRGIFISGGSRNISVDANDWALIDTLVSVKPFDGNTGCKVEPQTVLSTDARAAGRVVLP